jgi:hypothetical protein
MNRRHYIGALGTVAVSAAGLWTAYQLDRGNVSATVSGGPDSLEFEVASGTDVRISVKDTGSQGAPYSGSFTLQDPNENDVLTGRLGPSETVMRTHTAEQAGTFRLDVDPQGTRLLVNVFLQDRSD